MASPAFATGNQSSSPFPAAGNVLTLTKPASLAVGDLLNAVFASDAATAYNADAPPAGWQSLTPYDYSPGAGDFFRIAVFSKVADASDVAATNFAFTRSMSGGGTVYWYAGAILRITGVGAPAVDGNPTTSLTTASATTLTFAGITANAPDSLILTAGFGYQNGTNSGASWPAAAQSGYAIASGTTVNNGAGSLIGGVSTKARALQGAEASSSVPFSSGTSDPFQTITWAIKSPSARAFRRHLPYLEM